MEGDFSVKEDPKSVRTLKPHLLTVYQLSYEHYGKPRVVRVFSRSELIKWEKKLKQKSPTLKTFERMSDGWHEGKPMFSLYLYEDDTITEVMSAGMVTIDVKPKLTWCQTTTFIIA